MANPTLLTQPFAANGDKNVIPNTTTVQGAFSQDKGFPAECSLPLGAGGVAPSRQDFNGAFNLLSALAYYAQKGYTWHWDAAQDYYKDCVVVDESDGNIYRCVNDVAAGGSAPSADSTNWQPAFDGRYLPLNGGALTGTDIYRAVTDSSIVLASCDSAYASKLQLFGYENSDPRKGGFVLRANGTLNPNTIKDLEGLPDGTLTWNGSGHKVEIKSMAFPSTTRVNVPITASSKTYTAPANGYVLATGFTASSINCSLALWTFNNTHTSLVLEKIGFYYNSGINVYNFIPITKGQVFELSWQNISNIEVYFVYAEGEV